MKKEADLLETINRLGTSAGAGLSSAGRSISDWYQGLDPTVRGTLLRGLIGAGIGGTITGGLAAATPRDPERRGGVMGKALLGALLGGGAAAGLPLGLKLLGSGIRFGNEDKRSLLTKGTDTVLYPFMARPATTGLGVAAGWHARQPLGELLNAVRQNPKTPWSAVRNAYKAMPKSDVPREIIRKGGKGIKQISDKIIVPGRGRLLMLPLALGAGVIGDRLLRGEG
jgi:hypothetical protein